MEVDDLVEEFYQHLMVCHHRLGQEGKAVEIYHRCRSMLSRAFGINPSSRTEEIYKSLYRP
jgi:two-component SAPR family response regulator